MSRPNGPPVRPVQAQLTNWDGRPWWVFLLTTNVTDRATTLQALFTTDSAKAGRRAPALSHRDRGLGAATPLHRPAAEGSVSTVGPRARLHREGRRHADAGSGGLRSARRPAGAVAAPLLRRPRHCANLRLPTGQVA